MAEYMDRSTTDVVITLTWPNVAGVTTAITVDMFRITQTYRIHRIFGFVYSQVGDATVLQAVRIRNGASTIIGTASVQVPEVEAEVSSYNLRELLNNDYISFSVASIGTTPTGVSVTFILRPE